MVLKSPRQDFRTFNSLVVLSTQNKPQARFSGLTETDVKSVLLLKLTARSLEDETQNVERNANRNPECWENFSQLVKIEKIKFLGISQFKVKLRF